MNTTTISKERSYIPPRKVSAIDAAKVKAEHYRALSAIGLDFSEGIVSRMAAAFDGLEAPLLTNTITTPVQFLQNWLPGFVYVMTQPRSIDELIGITTIGDAIDEEIVQPTLEHAGKTALYGDLTNIPLAGVGNGFERRTITRHEMGLRVGWLEEQRAGRAAVNVAAEKRAAAGLALEITRNRIGFYGFNNGVNLTYGFLNDPGLPAYVAVPAGTGGTTWATKTMDEICGDIRIILGALQSGSKGLINLETTTITLALALDVSNQLTKINALGLSVKQWLRDSYPTVTIKSSVDLNGANGGANVMYAYAENVPGTGTDGGRVIEQFVPSKFQMLGSEKGAKHYTEDFLMATAGVMVKRPWAVKRYTGFDMTYYVYSTLACDNVYDAYGPAVDGLPQSREGILIRGGYGVATKALVTPRGAVTPITDEQYARLQDDAVFKLHRANGFLTVEQSSAPAEAVAANMAQNDPSVPLEVGDLELDPDSPMAETGPSKRRGRPPGPK